MSDEESVLPGPAAESGPPKPGATPEPGAVADQSAAAEPGTALDPGTVPEQRPASEPGPASERGRAPGGGPAPEPGGRESPSYSRVIIGAILQDRPAVVTVLAIFSALVLGGLIIAFSDTTVLHAWSVFFSAPGSAISAAWQAAAAAYSALFEGSIVNPHTVTAAFHGGPVGAIFYPISQTVSQATPEILTGLAVALAFRAGMFNIGAASQWIGGAIVVTYLGFAVSMPPVIHVLVCLIGGFAGGAVMGWIVGDLKARTGAHEVIVTIMINYVMYDVLSYVLDTPSALQQPHQANLISPTVATNAQLPHVGGPPPQAGLGFIVALLAAGGMWWLLERSTLGFEFRTVGANPNAARSAGMSVQRTWILAMLLAGGLAGLSGAVTIQGTAPFSLNTQSYGTYGIDGITIALLGRAKPVGVVLAALLFGALNAGGTAMEAATSVPVDISEVIEGLIVLFVAAPPLIRAVYRLRKSQAGAPEAVAKGWNG
ncbi:MAG TPA: ABC transporter permease [Streptosporangiaceae bacterium]